MVLGRTTLALQKLIPTRFLTLTAHLVLTICLFWSMESNLIGTIGSTSEETYEKRNVELTVALSVTFVCFLIEYLGFLSGVTMFSATITLFSSFQHAIGTILLSVFILHQWQSHYYWFIFGFCSALPAAVEVLVIARTLESQNSQVTINS